MRDVYRDTIASVAADGTIKALSNVEITVYLAGTTTLATIYQREDPASNAQGPAPEVGASGGPNPFTTGPLGAIEFWCAAGLYEVHVRDLNAQERIARRGAGGTAAPIKWNSSPMSAGSIPTSVLAQDGGLQLGHDSAAVQRQDTQIGQVIDWWRPTSAVPIPVGFEIADGRQIAAGQHDFPGVAGAVNLPDLRNLFVIGADPNKADGTVSSPGNGTAVSGAQHPNAPGIGGSGGSNAVHGHTIPAHYHGRGTLGASSSSSSGGAGTGVSVNGDGAHNHIVPRGVGGPAGSGAYSSTFDQADMYTIGAGSHGHGISDPSHSHSVSTSTTLSGNIGATGSGVNGDGAMSAGTTDGRPLHFGLLKLIKVRRA